MKNNINVRSLKYKGRQWETTPVDNFPRKITMKNIIRWESSMALEEEK